MRLKDYTYLYNAAAHFAAAEKYPGPEGLFGALKQPGEAALEALCWTLAETSKQGELLRRYMGETPKETMTAEEWMLKLKPAQIRAATALVMQAISDGLGKGEESEEVDEILEKKKKKTESD